MSCRQEVHLLRAHGRCTGALIFAAFGACWLLLSCAYFHRFHPAEVLTTCLLAGLLAAAIAQTRRNRSAPVLDAELERQKKQQDRAFGILNAVTYGAVFLLFAVLPRLGLQNYIFPGFVALVGLHFFPMPSLYRHTANLIVGTFMVFWAVSCAVLFRSDGNRMAAFVALGAGIALWCSSISALITANRLFRIAGEGRETPVGTS